MVKKKIKAKSLGSILILIGLGFLQIDIFFKTKVLLMLGTALIMGGIIIWSRMRSQKIDLNPYS